ncbi:uncharacterized protein [Rutidosis leptorrhynchoides]|uniref:uncharacterized protein n=1 Tax=Rutidosis leptorrhynchoides TaxID=125765 RepID=UPI003A98E3BE
MKYLQILDKTVNNNRKVWQTKHDNVLWAFRTAYKTPNATTPFKLVYGKACHLPVEVEHMDFWALKQVNLYIEQVGKKRAMQVHELDELRLEAYENSLTYKEKTKKWHDSLLKEIMEFLPNDKFLVFNSRFKVSRGKLRSMWTGLYVVKKAYPSGSFHAYGKTWKNMKNSL